MTLQAGDIGFHKNNNIQSWFIRWAESRKYGHDMGRSSPSHWNHVFMMTSPDTLIEANPAGVQESPLSKYVGKYQPVDTVWYRPVFPEVDGAARTVAAMQSTVGEKYDDLVLVSDALYLLFSRFKPRFGLKGHATCSGGTVSRALELGGGIDMGDWENCNTPADVFAVSLANFWLPEGV